MRYEKTIFLLKPGRVLECRYAICEEIKNWGLQIEKSREVILTENHLITMYPNLSDELWNATVEHLLGKQEYCPVFLVTGNDSIRRLANYAGRHVDPSQCKKETIRFRYSDPPRNLGNGSTYYPNGIHCPKNPKEANRDINLFFRDS